MKTSIIEIKNLIQSGKVEQAFETFINEISDAPKQRIYKKVAQQNLAYFKRIKRKETQGVLNNEDLQIHYNRINSNFLQLLDHYEDGTPPPPELLPEVNDNKWKKQLLWLIGGIVIILLAGLGLFFNQQIDDISCPGFSKKSDLNVLILPFKNLSDGGLAPEITIKERLESLCKKHQLNSVASIFSQFYQKENAQYPSYEEAEEVGEDCNAGLVVWGTAEKVQERIALTAKFRLTDQDSKFNLTKIQLEGETIVDTLRTVSSISKKGTITKDIEKLILTLFGVVAYENKNFAAAAEALETVSDDQDTSSSLMTNMLLAESYLELNENEKALKTYDKALEIHPNYNLALNNRGTLLVQNQEYEKAEKDFTNIIQRNPDNVNALTSRALIYAKMNNQEKAIRDIDAAKKINPKIRDLDFSKIKAVNSLRPRATIYQFKLKEGNPKNSKYFSNEKYAVSFYPDGTKANVKLANDAEFGSKIIVGLHFPKRKSKVKFPIYLGQKMENNGKYFIKYGSKYSRRKFYCEIHDEQNKFIKAKKSSTRLGSYKRGDYFMIIERKDHLDEAEYIEVLLTGFGNRK